MLESVWVYCSFCKKIKNVWILVYKKLDVFIICVTYTSNHVYSVTWNQCCTLMTHFLPTTKTLEAQFILNRAPFLWCFLRTYIRVHSCQYILINQFQQNKLPSHIYIMETSSSLTSMFRGLCHQYISDKSTTNPFLISFIQTNLPSI